MILTEDDIHAIERPDPRLLWLYMIRAVMTGPGLVIAMPLLFFRYETLRYRFDDEGIHMRWGLLFRRQINLTYARIQDIHLTSGLIQRWMGLADVQIQTASGSAGAEMTLEGLLDAEAIRDYLYTRMRGYRERNASAGHVPGGAAAAGQAAIGVATEDPRAMGLLTEAVAELRAAREALERLAAARNPAGQAGQVAQAVQAAPPEPPKPEAPSHA
jgi:putative membrane protein